MIGAESFIDDLETRAERDLERVKDAAARPARPAPADQEPPPEVRLIRGDSIEPEPINWLWLDWLACGKFHILAGAPGTLKTTIALSIAAAITAGRKWPDGTKAPRGNVVIWSGEDDPADTLIPRLLAAGADPRRVYIVSGTDHKGEHRPFDPSKDMDALRAAALAIGDIRLLIADPVVSAVSGDSHKNSEVRRALQPLVDLGAALDCAVLGISHFTKGTGGRDPVERVTGSIAFAALARVVLVTSKPEDGPRVLARAKSNIGPDSDGFTYELAMVSVPGHPEIEATTIKWGASIAGTARDLLDDEPEDQKDDPFKGRCGDCARWLLGLLSDGQLPATEVFKLALVDGFDKRMVQRARKLAKVEATRDGFGPGSRIVWGKGDSDTPTTQKAVVYDIYGTDDKNRCIGDNGDDIGDSEPIGDKPEPIGDIGDKATEARTVVIYDRGVFDTDDGAALL